MRWVFAIIALAAFAGSAPRPPETLRLKVETATRLSGATYRIVAEDPPPFDPHRAGELLGAVIGPDPRDAAAIGAVDPTERIETALAAALAERYGGVVAGAPLDLRGGAKPAQVLPTPGEILVDATPVRWGFWPFPGDFSHYRVIYVVKAEIIGGAAAAALARHQCARIEPSEAEAAPSLEALLADGAARLNRTLRRMAEDCAAEIKRRML